SRVEGRVRGFGSGLVAGYHQGLGKGWGQGSVEGAGMGEEERPGNRACRGFWGYARVGVWQLRRGDLTFCG
ncbi:MAG: hypothetical protein ACPL0F_05470, partial [bacterium]